MKNQTRTKFGRLAIVCAALLAACGSSPTPTAVPPTAVPPPAPTSAPPPTAAPAPTAVPKPTDAPKPTDVPKPAPTATAAAAKPAPLGVTKGNTTKTGGKAEEAAATQAVALSKADLATVGATTCTAEREKIVATYKAALDGGTTFDISGAAVKEISYDGTTAVVELAGAKIVAAGVSTAIPPSFAKVIEEGGKWVLCGAAPAPTLTAAEAPATGAITADYGFRPTPNGFAFENYGEKLPDGSNPVNLTPADVRRLFGDAVCASLNGNECILTPAGQQWTESANKAMNGGHCEGMAVLAALYYGGLLNPADFGAPGTFDIKLAGNEKLQREIAYWFVTQFTPPSGGTERKDMKPAAVVEEIKAQLAKGKDGEFYVVGIYQPGYKGGHAVTPFAVKEDGDIARIMVYDNNHVGKERFITVDKKTGVWSYNAAINPSAPSSEYKGDDTTFTLTIAPIRIRTKQQTCPFCAASATGETGRNALASPQAGVAHNEIFLTGDANLLITDGNGKRLGYVAGKLVSEIPDAYFQPVKSGDFFADEGEPVYYVPRGIKFTVTLDGTGLKADSNSSVTMIGPGYVLEVENVVVKPNQKDTITFAGDGTEMTYATTSKETPNLIVGIETPAADYEFDVKAVGEANGQQFTLRLETKEGRLGITTKDLNANTTYDIVMSRIDKAGEEIFEAAGIELEPNVTDYVLYGDWGGNKKPLKFGTDTNNDGKIDETITVDDAK
jgi:hypothetical protein